MLLLRFSLVVGLRSFYCRASSLHSLGWYPRANVVDYITQLRGVYTRIFSCQSLLPSCHLVLTALLRASWHYHMFIASLRFQTSSTSKL